MEEAGLREAKTYVFYLQNTAAQFIETRPIMDLCIVAKRRPGQRVAKSWGEQEGLDLVSMRMVDWEVEKMEGDEETDGMGTDTGD